MLTMDYHLLSDLNLDGVITQADLNLHSNYLGRTGGANVLSVDDEANDIGYAGYVWNDERAQWHVRNRELSPKLGRWLQRDPIHYAAGTLNIYGYVSSSPARFTDSFGLAEDPDFVPPWNETDSCPEGLVPLWVCKGKPGGDGTDPHTGGGKISHSYVACDNPYTNPDSEEKFGKHPRKFDSRGEWVPGYITPRGEWIKGYYRKSSFRGPGYINPEKERDPSKATCKKRCVDPDCKAGMCKEGPSPKPYRFLTNNCHDWAEDTCPDLRQ